MKTDQLIDMLSTNLEPVKRGHLIKTLAVALLVGGAAAFCVMLTTVGLRTDANGGLQLGSLLVKLLFTLTLIGVGSAMLAKLICPGQNARNLNVLVLLAFATIGVTGIVALVAQPSMAWAHMVMGTQWWMCTFCIPGFAIIPFAALIWALRQGAPTNLRRTGAVAGLVAGALGAVAYAFHCPDDSIPFIALWYGAMVALCAGFGAVIGPRVLRW